MAGLALCLRTLPVEVADQAVQLVGDLGQYHIDPIHPRSMAGHRLFVFGQPFRMSFSLLGLAALDLGHDQKVVVDGCGGFLNRVGIHGFCLPLLPASITARIVSAYNLAILRERIPDESVDLVYLDPPFNSSANYNVLFAERSGEQSQAQITACGTPALSLRGAPQSGESTRQAQLAIHALHV